MLSSGSYLFPPDPNVRADDPVVIAFYALQIIGGNVLVPVMFLASFVQGTKYSRSPIFINFCVGWIVYSIGFLLSFYSGRWKRDVEPIPWLCEVQAVLVFVLPIWTAATTLALIFELWTGVTGRRRSGSNKEPRARFPLRTLVLFIFPYFCAAFMAIAAGLVSQSRPDLVGLRLIFCVIDFRPLRTTVSILCAVALAVAFALQFDIGRHMYWKPSFGATSSHDWYHRALFVRMLIFLVILGVGSLAALFSSINSYDFPRLIIQAIFPLSVWLVFGTNPAIYKRESRSVPISKA